MMTLTRCPIRIGKAVSERTHGSIQSQRWIDAVYLIDTNIMSELLRPRPNPGVLVWSEQQAMFYFSVISVEETLYGLSRKENSRLLDAYKAFVQQYCERLFVGFEDMLRLGICLNRCCPDVPSQRLDRRREMRRRSATDALAVRSGLSRLWFQQDRQAWPQPPTQSLSPRHLPKLRETLR